jgi:hypothetical protein
MKQTAVEYLEEFLKQYDCAYSSLDYYELKIPMHIFDKKIGQAKEMERQQITDVWLDGRNSRSNGQDPLDQIKNL